MLSLIDVRCPHCGARGQLMLPPLGALIVGPCPECREFVVVFGGRVLPLDKDVMLGSSFDERREHLMAVLTSFLEERVVRLLEEASSKELPEPDEDIEELDEILDEEEEMVEPLVEEPAPRMPETGKGTISAREVDSFVQVDLKLLDNQDYFKAVFG